MSSVGNGEEFDDAAERLGERVEQFRDNAEEAGRRGLDTMQNSLADLYDGVADESSRALDTIEQNIEDHPWISLLVGFGLGCLVGGALLRRH